ncbi:MAG: hypothetical protein QXD89_00430 [Candidatus Aenigmatarchaeota archaeon]
MKEKKMAIIVTYFFGIIIGTLSYFINNYLLSIVLCVSLYFALYLTFRRIFTTKEFFSNTSIGYIGFWFLVWVILINLVG